jgi:hypothetical protein
VINLMDALRKSVGGGSAAPEDEAPAKKPAAKAVEKKADAKKGISLVKSEAKPAAAARAPRTRKSA